MHKHKSEIKYLLVEKKFCGPKSLRFAIKIYNKANRKHAKLQLLKTI